MIRGTTPMIRMNVTNGGELDLTQVEDIYVTLRQGSTIITKKDGLEVDAQSVGFSFTQRESLKLKEGPAEVQINWVYVDPEDNVNRRAATRIQKIEISGQLLDEVI